MIDPLFAKIALYEMLKIMVPSLIVYIIMKINHKRIIKKIARNISKERYYKETEYLNDYIQRL